MDFIVKLLFLSGRYVTQVTGKTIVEIIRRSIELHRSLIEKCELAVQVVEPYDNMLELLNTYVSSYDDMQLSEVQDKLRKDLENFDGILKAPRSSLDKYVCDSLQNLSTIPRLLSSNDVDDHELSKNSDTLNDNINKKLDDAEVSKEDYSDYYKDLYKDFKGAYDFNKKKNTSKITELYTDELESVSEIRNRQEHEDSQALVLDILKQQLLTYTDMPNLNNVSYEGPQSNLNLTSDDLTSDLSKPDFLNYEILPSKWKRMVSIKEQQIASPEQKGIPSMSQTISNNQPAPNSIDSAINLLPMPHILSYHREASQPDLESIHLDPNPFVTAADIPKPQIICYASDSGRYVSDFAYKSSFIPTAQILDYHSSYAQPCHSFGIIGTINKNKMTPYVQADTIKSDFLNHEATIPKDTPKSSCMEEPLALNVVEISSLPNKMTPKLLQYEAPGLQKQMPKSSLLDYQTSSSDTCEAVGHQTTLHDGETISPLYDDANLDLLMTYYESSVASKAIPKPSHLEYRTDSSNLNKKTSDCFNFDGSSASQDVQMKKGNTYPYALLESIMSKFSKGTPKPLLLEYEEVSANNPPQSTQKWMTSNETQKNYFPVEAKSTDNFVIENIAKPQLLEYRAKLNPIKSAEEHSKKSTSHALSLTDGARSYPIRTEAALGKGVSKPHLLEYRPSANDPREPNKESEISRPNFLIPDMPVVKKILKPSLLEYSTVDPHQLEENSSSNSLKVSKEYFACNSSLTPNEISKPSLLKYQEFGTAPQQSKEELLASKKINTYPYLLLDLVKSGFIKRNNDHSHSESSATSNINQPNPNLARSTFPSHDASLVSKDMPMPQLLEYLGNADVHGIRSVIHDTSHGPKDIPKLSLLENRANRANPNGTIRDELLTVQTSNLEVKTDSNEPKGSNTISALLPDISDLHFVSCNPPLFNYSTSPAGKLGNFEQLADLALNTVSKNNPNLPLPDILKYEVENFALVNKSAVTTAREIQNQLKTKSFISKRKEIDITKPHLLNSKLAIPSIMDYMPKPQVLRCDASIANRLYSSTTSNVENMSSSIDSGQNVAQDEFEPFYYKMPVTSPLGDIPKPDILNYDMQMNHVSSYNVATIPIPPLLAPQEATSSSLDDSGYLTTTSESPGMKLSDQLYAAAFNITKTDDANTVVELGQAKKESDSLQCKIFDTENSWDDFEEMNDFIESEETLPDFVINPVDHKKRSYSLKEFHTILIPDENFGIEKSTYSTDCEKSNDRESINCDQSNASSNSANDSKKELHVIPHLSDYIPYHIEESLNTEMLSRFTDLGKTTDEEMAFIYQSTENILPVNSEESSSLMDSEEEPHVIPHLSDYIPCPRERPLDNEQLNRSVDLGDLKPRNVYFATSSSYQLVDKISNSMDTGENLESKLELLKDEIGNSNTFEVDLTISNIEKISDFVDTAKELLEMPPSLRFAKHMDSKKDSVNLSGEIFGNSLIENIEKCNRIVDSGEDPIDCEIPIGFLNSSEQKNSLLNYFVIPSLLEHYPKSEETDRISKVIDLGEDEGLDIQDQFFKNEDMPDCEKVGNLVDTGKHELRAEIAFWNDVWKSYEKTREIEAMDKSLDVGDYSTPNFKETEILCSSADLEELLSDHVSKPLLLKYQNLSKFEEVSDSIDIGGKDLQNNSDSFISSANLFGATSRCKLTTEEIDAIEKNSNNIDSGIYEESNKSELNPISCGSDWNPVLLSLCDSSLEKIAKPQMLRYSHTVLKSTDTLELISNKGSDGKLGLSSGSKTNLTDAQKRKLHDAIHLRSSKKIERLTRTVKINKDNISDAKLAAKIILLDRKQRPEAESKLQLIYPKRILSVEGIGSKNMDMSNTELLSYETYTSPLRACHYKTESTKKTRGNLFKRKLKRNLYEKVGKFNRSDVHFIKSLPIDLRQTKALREILGKFIENETKLMRVNQRAFHMLERKVTQIYLQRALILPKTECKEEDILVKPPVKSSFWKSDLSNMKEQGDLIKINGEAFDQFEKGLDETAENKLDEKEEKKTSKLYILLATFFTYLAGEELKLFP